MEETVDTRVTLSLHPINVQKLDGYDEETAGLLGRTENAFETAYTLLGKVHDASEAAQADATLTKAAALVKASDYAESTFKTIAKAFDSASDNLKVVIAGIEKDLSAPIASQTSNTLSAEIRSYVKGMTDGERMTFVQKAITDGDTRTASAVLGAPAYLSGITTDMQTVLTRMYHEHHEPLKAKRLRAANAALDLLGQRAGLVFSQLEKAVGAPRATVDKHRAAAARTAKAFAREA